MPTCTNCKGTEFYKEAGFFFCKECQTKDEELRDEVLELRLDGVTRFTRRKIRYDNADKSADQEARWTSWEQYNFILVGLTNELIELGASPDIKLTVLQLWATYLGKLEVAFTSTEKKSVPKLARVFHKKDSEIIYGRLLARKRSRKRRKGGTSASSLVSSRQSETSSAKDLSRQKRLMVTADYDRYVQSQAGSNADTASLMNQSLQSVQSSTSGTRAASVRVRYSKHAKKEAKRVKHLSKKLPPSQRVEYQRKHVTTKYRTGPEVITPMKLWAILYLALRLHEQNIHLADMLRYGREGHLSYYKLDHLLPSEMVLSESDISLLTQNNEITHNGMRRLSAKMAKLLTVQELDCPKFMPLVDKYCQELQLPRAISTYIERLIASHPPKMVFNEKDPLIPNYEGRAMAFVMVVLKVLFGLDGITEYCNSRVAEKLNRASIAGGNLESKLFSFGEWQRYIECRRTILANVHFPTKVKHDPEAAGNSHLYIRFVKSIQAKREGDERPITNYKNRIPRDLAYAMKQCVGQLNEKNPLLKDTETFQPSLTPEYSYMQQLLEHPMYDLPDVLRNNFTETKVSYLMKTRKLEKLAAEYNISLEVVDSSLHFVHKIMPQFDQPRLPSIDELNELVKLESHEDSREDSSSRDDSTKYLGRRNPGLIRLNSAKQALYDRVENSMRKRVSQNRDETEDFEVIYQSGNSTREQIHDFGFENVSPNGQLIIANHFDSEGHDSRATNSMHQTGTKDNRRVQKEFMKKYNLHSSSGRIEIAPESDEIGLQLHSKSKLEFIRDSEGKFIKQRLIQNKSTDPNQIDIVDLVSDKKLSISGRERDPPPRSKKHKKGKKRESRLSPEIEIIHEGAFVSSQPDISIVSDDNEVTIIQDEGDDDRRRNESHSANSDNVRPLEMNSDDSEKLFKPCGDYWMYHCIFSRVKPKNFEVFQAELPVSFKWLLNECASIVEMSTQDLYEQVCSVETYYAYVLKPEDVKRRSTEHDYRGIDSKIKQCQMKW